MLSNAVCQSNVIYIKENSVSFRFCICNVFKLKENVTDITAMNFQFSSITMFIIGQFRCQTRQI